MLRCLLSAVAVVLYGQLVVSVAVWMIDGQVLKSEG